MRRLRHTALRRAAEHPWKRADRPAPPGPQLRRAGIRWLFAVAVATMPLLSLTAVFLLALTAPLLHAAAAPDAKSDGDVGSPAAAGAGSTYEKDVRPIFKAHCFQCHGEEAELKGGLDLRLVRLMRAGGDSGAAMLPGQPDESLIWQRVVADEMPAGRKKLTALEKETLRRWIAGGARTARPEPEDPADARYTAEELSFWAFQPVSAPKPPRPTSLTSAQPGSDDVNALDAEMPLDSFIAQRLRERQLDFSPPASRATLLRRVTFDLIGLPPTVKEIEDFLSDDSPEAFARVVDRLLSSPQYGARWGRHWLDVAGYAESDGVQGNDRVRPHAWHFRDYVLRAFNSDKSYDQFLIEQLAGDELLQEELRTAGAAGKTPSGPLTLDKNNARHRELLAATGFLRMAPDTTDAEDTMLTRNQAVADTIKLVGSAVLGLTVGCAQCHDHRYDPISIEDYYSFRAIFDPAFPLPHWHTPSQRLIDLTDEATQAERDRIEAEAVKVEQDIRERRRAHCQTIQDREIAKAPAELQAALRAAVNAPADKQTEEQKRLLDLHPTVRTIDWIVGQLVEYDMPTYRKFEAEEQKVAELRETKPLQHLVMAVQEAPDELPTSAVLFRGDPAQATTPVRPAELYVLRRQRTGGSPRVSRAAAAEDTGEHQQLSASQRAKVSDSPAIQDTNPVLGSSGRRLAYARQLTDGSHPLVARVIVNRVWLHHFGSGLVPTPGDFGFFGQPPTHPELLDYLAAEFERNGWSLKWLHRQLLLSRTYRQSSQVTPQLSAVDPDNQWWGRMNLRRADAEVVRDAILAVSNVLNQQQGGPSVPVDENAEGKAVIGKRAVRDGLRAGLLDSGSQGFRRSVFVSTKRDLPLNVLETFDLPAMNPNCHQRMATTGTPQSLWFLNDEMVVEMSQRMAEDLQMLAPQAIDQQLRLAFLRLFAVPPTAAEMAECRAFLETQVSLLQAQPDEQWQKQMQASPQVVRVRSLATLCQMLMASNRFLYIE